MFGSLVIFLFVVLEIVDGIHHRHHRHYHKRHSSWEELKTEIDSYDHRLGKIRNYQTLVKWRSKFNDTFDYENFDSLIPPEPVSEFVHQYRQWASNRYKKFCLEKSFPFDNQELADACHYLNHAMELFTDNSWKVWNNILSLTRELSPRITRISIRYRGQSFNCQESLEEKFAKMDDVTDIKKIFIECQKMLSEDGIPELFESIRHRVSDDNFKRLWAVKNSDLGIDHPEWALSKAIILWNRFKPFYRLLFKFIRNRLWNHFGPEDTTEYDRSTIPVHWLRSLIGTRLISAEDLLKPYPEAELPPLPEQLSARTLVMDFYKKLGFPELPARFWKVSRIVSDGQACHPFATPVINDSRINICLTNDTLYDSNNLFHEIGHIYYYRSRFSRNLYFSEDNTPVHESIGEVIRLLWNGCRLANQTSQTTEKNRSHLLINQLMHEAISSFVIIPYGISLELWRYRTFTNMVNKTMSELEDDYWRIRRLIQGFRPPNTMVNDGKHLYPLFKFHISNFVPYLRYIFSTVLMHQFHLAICRQGSQISLMECCPKHSTDLDNFRTFLQIDLSPSPSPSSSNRTDEQRKVLREFFQTSNQIRFDPQPLLDYYQPLIQWLEHQTETTT